LVRLGQKKKRRATSHTPEIPFFYRPVLQQEGLLYTIPFSPTPSPCMFSQQALLSLLS